MKDYYARIPFGHEQRLNLGFGNTCPMCDVQRDSRHQDGCPAEECPKCRRPVVDCFCECLEPWEELRIIKGIEKQFTCLADAHKAGAGVGNRKSATMTPTDKAAVMYVMANVPPELKKKFDAGFEKFFPGLKPCSTNENGIRMYRADDVAEALDMDKDEVNEMCRAINGEDRNPVSAATNLTFN